MARVISRLVFTETEALSHLTSTAAYPEDGFEVYSKASLKHTYSAYSVNKTLV